MTLSLGSKSKAKADLKASINRAFDHSWKLVNSQKGWNEINAFFFKRNKSLDKLEWRRRSRGNKKTSGTIYRVTATLPGTLETVSALLRDVNNMGSWNQVLQSSHVVESLDKDMMISYQITATNKSLLFPRDFVYGLKFGLIDGCFVAGGCSVDYNGPGCDESVDGEVVRAVLWPGCVVARPIPGMPKATTLQWLLDIDYKGWAPRCLLDWTVPFAQVLFVESLCKALEEAKLQDRMASAMQDEQDDISITSF